ARLRSACIRLRHVCACRPGAAALSLPRRAVCGLRTGRLDPRPRRSRRRPRQRAPAGGRQLRRVRERSGGPAHARRPRGRSARQPRRLERPGARPRRRRLLLGDLDDHRAGLDAAARALVAGVPARRRRPVASRPRRGRPASHHPRVAQLPVPGLHAEARVKITAVTCHVLLDPGFEADATSSAQDTIVVEVETDEGVVGIGETDLNAWLARACIEAPGMHTMDGGLAEMLLGLDPLDPVSVWNRLYVGTAMTGRRGAVVHALGALDMALWDICGKAAGKPTWQVLGEAAHQSLTPYASLLPHARDLDSFQQAIVDQATWAKNRD